MAEIAANAAAADVPVVVDAQAAAVVDAQAVAADAAAIADRGVAAGGKS